jgi:hypothetical protein
MFQRGPVVGWVVDLHPGADATIDVRAAADLMAARVESVIEKAESRPRAGFDAAQLLSVPLPREAYGARGDGLVWDWWFAGCTDAVEVAAISGEEVGAEARRLGRITGCTAMYDRDGDLPRLFSGVAVYGNAGDASEALAGGLTELEARGGHRFEVPNLGDEAVGLATPPSGEISFTDTRVVMRFGAFDARIVIQEQGGVDATADVVDLARQLETRITAVLGNGR